MRKVECGNNGYVFRNVEEAAKYYGIKVKKLQKCLDGKRKWAGKDKKFKDILFWNYVPDDAILNHDGWIDLPEYNAYIKGHK